MRLMGTPSDLVITRVSRNETYFMIKFYPTLPSQPFHRPFTKPHPMSSSHIQPSDASIASFAQRKAHTLSAVDLSPKGSIDTPILPLIELLNSHHLISTTSSCSGRISVFLDGELSTTGKGGGGRWVLISHEVVEVSDAVERVWKEMSFDADNEGKITGRRFLHFKFEPMVGTLYFKRYS